MLSVTAQSHTNRSEKLTAQPRVVAPLPRTSGNQLVGYLGKKWLRSIALAIAAFVVHSPALQGERIWDDQFLCHDNPLIKSPLLVLEAFRHYLFLDSSSTYYRPLQNISFQIDYFFWNTDAWGFHLTNVLLHAGAGILLYCLLQQLLPAILFRHASAGVRARLANRTPSLSAVAFCIALVWVVHPVHSAAVDYISGRADSLAFLFACAGWLLFLRAQRALSPIPRSLIYFLAGLAGLLSLLSRETGLVWFGLFLGYVFLIEISLSVRTRLWIVVSCVVLVGGYTGLRHFAQRPAEVSTTQQLSVPTRAALMTRALGDYGRLLLVPTNLHMDRTVVMRPTYRRGVTWREAVEREDLSILGVAAFAILAWGSLKHGCGRPARVFGASWFLASYLPISNIVPLGSTVAEHWLYLPSVGAFIFVAGWLIELPRSHRPLLTAAVGLAALALGGRSFCAAVIGSMNGRFTNGLWQRAAPVRGW